MTILFRPSELRKAKKAAIGTVSTHGGKKVKKTPQGRVPVVDNRL